MPTITFKNENLTFTVCEGIELLQAKKQNPGMPIKFGCTLGDCGVCAIRIQTGKENLTKMCEKEKNTLIRKGLSEEQYRLSCQCALNGSIEIS